MFDVIDTASERIYILKLADTGSNLRFFEESVNEFIKSDQRDMIVDMEGQEIVSSLLLAALIRIRNGMFNNQRALILKNCTQNMYRCIEMAGLESFFSFSS